MATSNQTPNYGLSQYAANDPVKFLTNYNEDMVKIDQSSVPNTRKIAGIPLSDDILLSELIAAGLAPSGNYPQISSGTWTPELRGETAAGAPTYSVRSGRYYKIGKLVIFDFSVLLTSKGGMSGGLIIAGLPFAAAYGSAVFTNLGGLSLSSGEMMVSGNVGGDSIHPNVASQNSVSVTDTSKISDTFLTYGSYGYYITA